MARSLGRTAAGSGAQESQSRRSSSLQRQQQNNAVGTCAEEEDVYKDFDRVYSSLRRKRPAPICGEQPALSLGGWSCEAARENEALADSLAGVELALRRATLGAAPPPPPPPPVPQLLVQSPGADSLATSEQTNTRPDSRNTNLSLVGPALVEEMTLSDLEDEIRFSLAAAKESERRKRLEGGGGGGAPVCQRQVEQLVRGCRSRMPLPAAISGLAAMRPTSTSAAFSPAQRGHYY